MMKILIIMMGILHKILNYFEAMLQNIIAVVQAWDLEGSVDLSHHIQNIKNGLLDHVVLDIEPTICNLFIIHGFRDSMLIINCTLVDRICKKFKQSNPW